MITVSANNTSELQKAKADILCDGIEDHIEIQQAINELCDIHLLSGDYYISDTVIINPGVKLIMEQRATVHVIADIDAFYVSKNAQIEGGRIDSRLAATYDSALLVFHGDEQYSIVHGMEGGITGAQNITLRGKGNYAGGYGIQFKCSDATSFATGLIFNNIYTKNFQFPIFIKMPDTDNGTMQFFNSNMFTNIYITNPYHTAIYVYNPYDSFSGNIFDNIHIQPSSTTQRAININGRGNIFSNIVLWDWVFEYPIIELGSRANQNYFIGWIDKKKILDKSTQRTNIVHDLIMQSLVVQESYNLNVLNNGNSIYEYPVIPGG